MAKVVVLVPAAGTPAGEKAGVVDAVELALSGVAPVGWVVETEQVAEGATRSRATSVAKQVAGDRDVIAVIGGLSDDVVRAVQPVLDRNGIPFISPADDTPEHTRGPDPSAPQRPYGTYFRTAVAGEDAEALAARYAVAGLGADDIVVVQRDRVSEAGRFAKHARSLGAGVEVVDPEDIVASLAGAEVVYVDGDARFAADVTTGIARSGSGASVIGGPDLMQDEFLAAAAAVAGRAVAIAPATLEPTVGLPVPGLAEPGQFGAAASDAAAAVAQALERCLPPVREGRASAARTGCLAELGAVTLDGVTGPVVFDAYGDRQGAWPQAHIVIDGAWHNLGHAMTR